MNFQPSGTPTLPTIEQAAGERVLLVRTPTRGTMDALCCLANMGEDLPERPMNAGDFLHSSKEVPGKYQGLRAMDRMRLKYANPPYNAREYPGVGTEDVRQSGVQWAENTLTLGTEYALQGYSRPHLYAMGGYYVRLARVHSCPGRPMKWAFLPLSRLSSSTKIIVSRSQPAPWGRRLRSVTKQLSALPWDS